MDHGPASASLLHTGRHAHTAQAQRHAKPQIDVASAIEEYLERRDWRVNANANQGYSLGGLIAARQTR
ncbi:hypothetical protein GWC77_00880 [Paraburkholderia sp. NMBU_R16]|nr:hypothetical protein [Paraburkholderia sp. NMBU_R16]